MTEAERVADFVDDLVESGMDVAGGDWKVAGAAAGEWGCHVGAAEQIGLLCEPQERVGEGVGSEAEVLGGSGDDSLAQLAAAVVIAGAHSGVGHDQRGEQLVSHVELASYRLGPVVGDAVRVGGIPP